MSRHNVGDTATPRGDATVHDAGDHSVRNIQTQVDNIRSEPGQGLREHQDRFRTADLSAMGFATPQFTDSSQTVTDATVQPASFKSGGDHTCHVDPGTKPDQKGIASVYGERQKTATGEVNDPHQHTAASKELPLNSKVCVTRPGETEGTEVRINDRGPYVKGRVIDMTPASANDINIDDLGKVNIYKSDKYSK